MKNNDSSNFALKMPKMIFFDYGHTLVYEDKWDAAKGAAAVMEYAIFNKDNLKPEQVAAFSNMLYFEMTRDVRKYGIEVHEHNFQNLVYDYLQIKIDLPPVRLEEVFWDGAAPAHAMPYINETLAHIRGLGIRTAVVSNISFSGEALKNRVNNVLPDNGFEFIIASSDYVVRKPNKLIFELALRKAGFGGSAGAGAGDGVGMGSSGGDVGGGDTYPVLTGRPGGQPPQSSQGIVGVAPLGDPTGARAGGNVGGVGENVGDVWFCGDSVDYDIIGARNVGIFPVWYESDIDCWYVERGSQIKPDYEHLHITDWRELIRKLDSLID